MESKRCETCEWFDLYQCYRFPPQAIAIRYADDRPPEIETHWPYVEPGTRACGEHEEKEKSNEKA